MWPPLDIPFAGAMLSVYSSAMPLAVIKDSKWFVNSFGSPFTVANAERGFPSVWDWSQTKATRNP
jgi:hypothetical protein